MLLARYFLSVGGVLLALLFVVDAVVPKLPAAATDRNDTDTDKAVIRIHSDRKWPERVVFDTSTPTTILPAQTANVEAVVLPPTPVADVSAKTSEREAFAFSTLGKLRHPRALASPTFKPHYRSPVFDRGSALITTPSVLV